MTYSIKNHKLYKDNLPIRSIESPNSRTGMNVKFLVTHYTASDSFENVIKRFADPTTKVSAHFVVGRDGKVAQCVSLNKVAYHAGTSQWKNIVGLNGHSFGIEMCNFGPLTKKGQDWFTWTGKKLPNDDIYIDPKGKGWQMYPHAQLEAVYDIAKELTEQYNLIDLLDHQLISPGRKQDSGPAFPLEDLRFRLFNRKNTL